MPVSYPLVGGATSTAGFLRRGNGQSGYLVATNKSDSPCRGVVDFQNSAAIEGNPDSS